MNINDLRSVYSMLEDAESKDVYLKRLNYIVTGKAEYIDQIVSRYLPKYANLKNSDEAKKILATGEKVIYYGTGNESQRCLGWLNENPGFIGFCDRDETKQRTGYCGYPCISPEKLLKKHRDAIVFINTLDYADEIYDFLHDNQFPMTNILRMDTYIGRELMEMYFDVPFFRFGENEVMVDAGCYNMQTTYSFAKFCKHLKTCFAFEPDPVNYQKCLMNKNEYGLSRVHLFPKATWSKKETLYFDTRANTASRITSDGNEKIETISIDEAVGDERVTFIKMDVEGAELESLQGASKTIINNRPKLAICMYHKREDMVTLPIYIKSLVPEYRLYVRHMNNDPCGTVLYAVS